MYSSCDTSCTDHEVGQLFTTKPNPRPDPPDLGPVPVREFTIDAAVIISQTAALLTQAAHCTVNLKTCYFILVYNFCASLWIFSARCNIYILRLCYDVSVRLSVTEVHWRIIVNLGFKFRSQFTTHCGRGACGREEIAGKSGGIISRYASHY